VLAPGTTLGPYKVITLIGSGGMGEVYRALDTRLGRDVALKVLAPRLAATPEVRARFEREARTISQLNHPHICTLYDVGRQEGQDYLVMELVKGETLARRLERGPLPDREALVLGAQIAEALDKAHRAGVVHRDLKPGNIMLTAGGAKLMDFGLARVAGFAPSAAAPADSPTISRPLTAEGTIVGTFQYIAPEQLEGKEADVRSDIWALGCVLYEMATGRRAFDGDSQASLIAAIMDREPPAITALKPMSPPALDHLVRLCLAKDPADRWQSARDVAHEFSWIAEVGSQAGVPAPPAMRRRRRERLAWGLALGALILAIGAAAALLVARGARRALGPAMTRFAVLAPGGATVLTDPSTAVISPDGRTLAFIAIDQAGLPRLWVRPLDALSAEALRGTENAFCPFWSADSRFLAFFTGGKLWKVAVAGGLPEAICDAPSGRGGSWSKDGVIVLAPESLGPLVGVPANGGAVVEIAKPDPARHETGLRFPCFLPDGRHFLYISLPRKQGNFDVYLGSLDSQEHRRILAARAAPVYAGPEHILFALGDRIVAQRFDLSKMRTVGDVLPLGDAPHLSSFDGAPLASASANGVLAHVATSAPDTKLVWLDRAGHQTGTITLPPGSYGSPDLSPDDRRAVLSKPNSPTTYDLWLVDLARPVPVPTRLTFDGNAAGGAGLGTAAIWSPDGSRIAYQYNRSGIYDVYQVLANGAGRPEPLVQSDVNFKAPTSWSPDGRYLVFGQNVEKTGWDLWMLPLRGDGKPVRYLCTPFDETVGAVSPDGRWLAFDSDETGTSEIYIGSFPDPGEKYRISIAGGTGAQWSRDGRELLIWTSDPFYSIVGPIYVVDVQTAPAFKAGTPRLLFRPCPDNLGIAATSDLKRFLTAVPVDGEAPPSITVTMNWPAALKR
jgi:eukaryotic-like serine/threonine-protein kinase